MSENTSSSGTAKQDGLTAVFDLADASRTAGFGAALAPLLKAGDVIALRGDLGAGKSTLARGLIQALTDPAQDVPSPTFTLVQTYDAGAVELWHFDLYRLEDPEEVFELGIEEAFAEAVSLIEWPERMGGFLPGTALTITLEHHGEGRRAVLSGDATWATRLSGWSGT